MHQLNDFISRIDGYIGGSQWFVFLLLGTGLFFTIYLKFPQFRYLKHSLRIVRGKFDKAGDVGDTTHFQGRWEQATLPGWLWRFIWGVLPPFSGC